MKPPNIHAGVKRISHEKRIERLEEEIAVKQDQIEILRGELQQEGK